MSDSTRSHKRTSPPPRKTSAHPTHTQTTHHAKKPSTLRPPRPVLQHRKSSSTGAPVSQHAQLSITKLGPGKKAGGKSRKNEDLIEYEPSAMATSFLQFCALCERQIIIPDNSVLYCSESCRRKDSSKPLSASFDPTNPVMTTTPPSSPPMSPRTIVPPMTPTGRSSPRPIPALRIPSEFHDSNTDLDPTEWKPVIARRNRSCVSLTSSDAWHYLSHFHGGEESLPVYSRRYNPEHPSTTSLSGLMNGTTAMPSLTHTPSTEASSFNSNSDYIGYLQEFTGTRPLPPRHNPSYSGSAAATKGVELVMPHITPLPVEEQTDTMDTPVVEPKNMAPHSTGAVNHDEEETENMWAKSQVQTPPVPAVSSFTTVLRLH